MAEKNLSVCSILAIQDVRSIALFSAVVHTSAQLLVSRHADWHDWLCLSSLPSTAITGNSLLPSEFLGKQMNIWTKWISYQLGHPRVIRNPGTVERAWRLLPVAPTASSVRPSESHATGFRRCAGA